MQQQLFVFTGGTISMRPDPATGRVVPALSGEEILRHVPGLPPPRARRVLDYARLPGPHATPEWMLELAGVLDQALADPKVSGAVVTHGTDTLEETAFLVDCVLQSTKPVVFVGSLRNSAEAGWDGPVNLRDATRVVADPLARGRGVLVCMNREVHAARDVVKAHTHALDAFTSPEVGVIACVDEDTICWCRPAPVRGSRWRPALDNRVELIPAAAGVDGKFVACALQHGARGLVLVGTGRGNVPPGMVPAVQQALDHGVVVVMSTRCLAGRVLPTYGYPGSGGDLAARGVIPAGRLPAAKARLMLMLLLGNGAAPEQIAGAMVA